MTELLRAPVPPGLCLCLFHGRPDPAVNPEDWGSQGPVFPIGSAHVTHNSVLRLHDAEGDELGELLFGTDGAEGLVYYDGVFYGDWSIGPAKPDWLLTPFDESKTKR